MSEKRGKGRPRTNPIDPKVLRARVTKEFFNTLTDYLESNGLTMQKYLADLVTDDLRKKRIIK